MGFDRLLRLAMPPLVASLGAAGSVMALTAGHWATSTLCVGAWLAGTAAIIRSGLKDTPNPEHGLGTLEAAHAVELARLRAIVDTVPLALVVINPDGSAQAINRAARRLFDTPDRLNHQAQDLREALDSVSGATRTLVFRQKDGRVRRFALTTSDLARSGEVSQLIALTDIDPELRVAEAAALRELFHVLGHEALNSLTPVISLAHTARTLLDGRPGRRAIFTVREALETLSQRAEGLSRFVDGYRRLARLPAPAPSAVDLDSFVKHLERLFVSHWGGKGIAFDRTNPPRAIGAFDPDLATQALINLLWNAAEASMDSAKPAVRLDVERGTDGILVFCVSDNGSGPETDDPESVFAPFVTSKPGGTGLGLSLARQIARAHGGDVSWTRTADSRTRFRLDLPSADPRSS